MTTFADAALMAANGLRPGDPTRVLLEYFLQNAKGRANAKTWGAIDRHLRKNGIEITKEHFQQTFLKETRRNSIFIGSNDHEPGRGYFLIVDKDDAAVAREFYTRRIKIQEENLDRLDELIKQTTWPGALHEKVESQVARSE